MQKGKIGREKRDKIIVEGWVNRKWVGICSSNITSWWFTLIVGNTWPSYNSMYQTISSLRRNMEKWGNDEKMF